MFTHTKPKKFPQYIGFGYYAEPPLPNTENGITYTQDSVRNAARNRHNVPHTGIPPHLRNQRGGVINAAGQNVGGHMQQQHQQQLMQQQQGGIQQPGQMQTNQPGGMNQQPQQVIEHDENLSDKEVFPGSMHGQHGQMVS